MIFSSGYSFANTSSAQATPYLRTLPTPDVQAYGHFGSSVGTSPGDLMLVGAENETVDGYVGAGRVYAFHMKFATLFDNLTSPYPQTDGHFGQSVAISAACVGNPCHSWRKGFCLNNACTIIVGAANETVNGNVGAGRAYIFNSNTSALVRTLTSPNSQYEGEFGWSMTAGGKLVVVGAPNETVNGLVGAGRAYVFNTTTGKLITTLTSPNPQTDGHFGRSASVSDNNVKSDGLEVVVGAPNETVNGLVGAGRAYVFKTKTGKLMFSLYSPNAQEAGHFGWSVSLSHYTIAVGAPSENSNGLRAAGLVYGYSDKTHKLLYSLESPNAQSGGYFGWSVSLSEQTLAVGAPDETVRGHLDAGRAYTFLDLNGSLIRTYASINVQTNGFFGLSITVVQGPGPRFPGYIVGIGAPDETVFRYVESGRVYL